MVRTEAKLAVRALSTAPWTNAAAVLLIALGVGANAAVFAVTYDVLIRPLPYAEPSRLVVMSVTTPDGADFGLSLDEVEQWRTRLRTIESLAGYTIAETPLRGLGEPRMSTVAFVTAGFFDVLHVQPAPPQLWRFAQERAATVLSERLAALASAPQLHGRTLQIGQRARIVVDVVSDRHAFPASRIDAWVRADPGATIAPTEPRRFQVLARLRPGPGATVAQARDDVVRLMREIRHPSFGMTGSAQAFVARVDETLRREWRPALRAATAGAILVLIVTCANVVMLLLGRAVMRNRDAAVCIALGAQRAHLVRVSAIESFLLAVAGAGTGVLLAQVVLASLGRFVPGGALRPAEGPFSLPAIAVVAVGATAVTALCGAAPAVVAARQDFTSIFRGSNLAAGRPRLGPGVLVALQIAAAVVLLVSALLLARSVSALLAQDPGVDASHTAILRLPLSAIDSDGRRTSFVSELLALVRRLPGVRAAGIGSSLPPRAHPFQIYVQFASSERREGLRMSIVSATPGFLEAIGARQVSGRPLSEADAADATAGAIVVSESAARFAAPGQDLAGRELPIRLPPFAKFAGRPRVAGIVRDARYAGLDMPAAAAIYVPWQARPAGVAHLAVRTDADPLTIAPAVQRIVRDLEPGLPIGPLRSFDEEIAGSVAEQRARVMPASAFAGVSLGVSVVGVFAVLARAAAERRREFAIRLALGASHGRVVRMMLNHAALLSLAGIAIGLMGTYVLGGSLRRLLFGVSPHDPATLATVGAFVAAASIVAAVAPAIRAARTPVQELLRLE